MAASIKEYLPQVLGAVGLLSFCWILGRCGFSIVWFVILLATCAFYVYKRRETQRNRKLLKQLATNEKEFVKAQMKELPAWVQFPDAERTEWINQLLVQMWPYIGEVAKDIVQKQVEPIIREKMPSAFKGFKFVLIDMGDTPPRLGGIKTYPGSVAREEAVLDVDVIYAGDCQFIVSVAGVEAGVKDVNFRGKARVVLRPLIPAIPLTGGVAVSLLDDPVVDFDLTGAGDMVEIPGLRSAMMSVVQSVIRSMLLLPNEIVVSLAKVSPDEIRLHCPEPEGVVHITAVEAKDLENRDNIGLIKGKSDPYVKLAVGSQFFKTRVIDNNLNPAWNETFEAIVDQASGQNLTLELFDYDPTSEDEELGSVTVELEAAKTQKELNLWIPLEGVKKGEVHLKVVWMNLVPSISPTSYVVQGLHRALLIVYIDSAQDLPLPKHNKEPFPYVTVTLGSETFKTNVQKKTTKPVFQQRFLFFVKEPTGQELRFQAMDSNTKRGLGELAVPLTSVVNAENMEIRQEKYKLILGAQTSTLILTLRLRGLQANEVDAEAEELDSKL